MSNYLKYIISKMDNILSRNSYISKKVTEAHFMARTAFKEEAEIQKLFWIFHLKFLRVSERPKLSKSGPKITWNG